MAEPHEHAGPPQPQWGAPQASGGWAQPPGYPYQGVQAPRKRRKWPWIVLAVVVLFIGGCVAIIAGVSHSVSNEINKTVKVDYKATGTASSVTVTYTTWNNGNTSTSQKEVTLPWTDEESSTGLFKGGTLTVTVGTDGGTATCSVSVDGATPKTADASGAFSSATCDAS